MSLTCSSAAAMCFPRRPNFSTITSSGMPLASPTSAAVIQRSGRYGGGARQPDASLRHPSTPRMIRSSSRVTAFGSSFRPFQSTQRMPSSSPIPISAHAVTSGSIFADLAARDRLAQRLDVALGELVVVVAEHLRRDELGLADDPVERVVLRGEPEVRGEAEQLGLEARLALRTRPPSSRGGRASSGRGRARRRSPSCSRSRGRRCPARRRPPR